MRRIDTLDELFDAGDPSIKKKGTTVRNWWLNAVQEELANIVEGVGGTLDPEDSGQLFDLLIGNFAALLGNASQVFRVATAVGVNDAVPLGQAQGLGLREASETLTGTSRFGTAAEVLAGELGDVVVSPAGLLAGLLGAGTGATDGYVSLPYRDAATGVRKTLLVQWGQVITSVSADVTAVFPVAYPTAMRGIVGIISDAGGSGNFTVSSGPFSQTSVPIGAYAAATAARVAKAAVWISWGH